MQKMAKRDFAVARPCHSARRKYAKSWLQDLETLVLLEMLLEDDETQTLARKTVKRCSKTSWLQNDSYPTAPCALAEILPETTVRA